MMCTMTNNRRGASQYSCGRRRAGGSVRAPAPGLGEEAPQAMSRRARRSKGGFQTPGRP